MITGKDMHVKVQNAPIFGKYHGQMDKVGQIDKFLEGNVPYSNVWEITDMVKYGAMKTMIDTLHCQRNRTIISGGNLTKTMIERTTTNSPAPVTGRTIRTWSGEAIREAKKMLSLVDEGVAEGILEKKTGVSIHMPQEKH